MTNTFTKERLFYPWQRLLTWMAIWVLGLPLASMGQTTISTTPTFVHDNGSGIVTFNFQNTNSYDIVITSVSTVMRETLPSTMSLWYKTTPVNGAPGIIATTNGWVQAASAPYTSTIASGTNQVMENVLPTVSLTIPANTTYGIAVGGFNGTTGTMGYHTIVPSGTITFSGGGCNILAGTNISYASTTSTAAATFTPRGFVGSITFSAASTATCPTPNTLLAQSITSSGASLNWTQSTGTPIGWQIKYGAPGFAPATAGTAVYTTSKPYPLTGLANSTSYDYVVRAVCAPGDTSAWSSRKNFTTLCNYPEVLTTRDSFTCGAGPVVLKATTGAGATLNWYASATGGALLGTGNTFTTPSITATTNYYVSAIAGSGAPTVNGSLATISTGGNGCTDGVMFNIVPTVNLTIDSFLNLSNLAQSATVSVYYKTGTYVGFETNAAAWTLAGTATVTTVSGAMATIRLPAGLALTAGTTYGIYLSGMSSAYTDGTGLTTYTNADMSLTAGVGLCSAFGGTNTPRIYNGTVFYHKGGGGCESPRQQVTASMYARPVVNLGNDTTICPGVTYVLNAGNPGATYEWNTTANTQTISTNAAGVYSVLVTSPNGCAGSGSIMITPGATPTHPLTATTSLCECESVLLHAGNSGCTYQWLPNNETSQAIVVTSPGTYSVTIKSIDGCKVTSATNVIQRPLPLPSLIADTSICPGDGIVLDAGNTGYNYSWNTGATTQTIPVTDSGTYEVLITSPYDCALEESVHVAYLPLPTTEGFNFIPLFHERLGKVQFHPLLPKNVDSYLWDFGDGSATTTLPDPLHTYASSGHYDVTLTVFNGCGNTQTTLPIFVDNATGTVSLEKNAFHIAVYPNPAQDRIRIESKGADNDLIEIQVYNMLGALVQTERAKGDMHIMEIGHLAKSLYTLRIHTKLGIVSKKIEVR